MAYEDNLPSGSWTSLPPPQFNTGLLATDQLTPYQRAMAQMQQRTPVQQPYSTGLLGGVGGYNPELFKVSLPTAQAINQLNANYQASGISGRQADTAAQQAAAAEAMAKLTPGEQAALQAMSLPNLANFLTPLPIKILMNILGAPAFGSTSSGGVSATSGSPMAGIASKGNVGQVANATTTAGLAASNAAAGNVGSTVGTTGGISASSGSPMGGMGSGAAGVAATAGLGGGDGGGGGGVGGGSGGGCCFIMLEARYGDGTMDSVVRRYRDEKITDRNKRGYYKLAEVFVPLMRESKIFKFMVAKTFADPLVSYGKYHYGENRHGWIFKPVERFWMKVFNVLGNDTKFIRENGETV
jgi:hypothetical protein